MESPGRWWHFSEVLKKAEFDKYRQELVREVPMPTLKLTLDAETYQRLEGQAIAERRPVGWQAEEVIRRALGLPCGGSMNIDPLDKQSIAVT